MRFGFLIHPITSVTDSFIQLDEDGGLLRSYWGSDALRMTRHMHETVERLRNAPREAVREPRVVDELALRSPRGVSAEGRLYEIPMDAVSILEDQDRALGLIDQAVQ